MEEIIGSKDERPQAIIKAIPRAGLVALALVISNSMGSVFPGTDTVRSTYTPGFGVILEGAHLPTGKI